MGLSVAPVSAAEPTADERARLDALLRRGDDAAKSKDWKACVDARWAALAIEDSARTAGDLGLCEEQAGRFGDAMNHLRRALADVMPGARTKEPWKSYQAAVIRLHSQVAMVVITMRPSGAYLVVDGRPYGKADDRRRRARWERRRRRARRARRPPGQGGLGFGGAGGVKSGCGGGIGRNGGNGGNGGGGRGGHSVGAFIAMGGYLEEIAPVDVWLGVEGAGGKGGNPNMPGTNGEIGIPSPKLVVTP